MATLISLEGIEFTGKSTLTDALSKSFTSQGYIVATARDPGTTQKAEQIRREVFKKTREDADPREIAKLYMEARADLTNQIIRPFLAKYRGTKRALFIVDRFVDSTRVYQGLIQLVPMSEIHAMERRYLDSLLPDITLICYFNAKNFESEWLKRKRQTLATREKNNNISVWHQNDFEKKKGLQENYLKAPQIARDHGETRIFELLDVCFPLEIILKNAENKILSHLSSTEVNSSPFDTV